MLFIIREKLADAFRANRQRFFFFYWFFSKCERMVLTVSRADR